MKKCGTRFLACFMACVIAFNVVAIPKAKAVATEAAVVGFSPAILALYMKSAGLSLTATSSAAGAAAMTEMIGGYAAATGTTASAVSGSIAAGAAISTSGAIILGVAAVALLAGITAWAISEYDLLAEDGTPTSEPVPVVPSDKVGFSYNGMELPELPDSNKKYAHIRGFSNGTYQLIFTSAAGTYENGNLCFPAYVFYTNYPVIDDTATSWGNSTGSGQWYSGTSLSFNSLWANFDVLTESGSLYLAGTQPLDLSAPLASVSVDEEYKAPIEIPETKQMVIDVGAGADATEDTVYNLVFNGIADGTLTSTYEVTDVDTGTDTEPDVGTDADTELGFLERIANGIDALADKIAEGFAEIFAPDPALMQDISDTFNSKFGFVSTLHQLGTDLLSIDATSAPPVVYIHLEDAEGSIYYGETVKALDMSWYARYKEDVDRIMSGFLWLGFLWLLFKRASAIIQGAEMATDYGVDVHDGYRIRGERNGKRF